MFKKDFSPSEELLIEQMCNDFKKAFASVVKKYNIDDYSKLHDSDNVLLMFLAQVKFTDSLNEMNNKAMKMIDMVINDGYKFRKENK
jgi:hypothetical protein